MQLGDYAVLISDIGNQISDIGCQMSESDVGCRKEVVKFVRNCFGF